MGLSTWPVKKLSSLHKNRIVSAMSFGVPRRPSGVSLHSCSSVSAVSDWFITVSMTPGATQLTRMPEGASSAASERADLLGKRLSHADQPGLGGGVGDLTRCAGQSPDGGNIHDGARLLMNHVRQRAANAIKRAG